MKRPPLQFDSLDDMLDAFMLFGGRLECPSGGNPRLIVKRSRPSWSRLAVAVAAAKMHGLHLTSTVEGDQIIRYRTNSVWSHAKAHRRWYPDGRATMPADLRLVDPMMCFWLLGSLGLGQGVVRLGGPKMDHRTHKGVIRSAAEILPVKFHDGRLEVDTQTACGWLGSRIPHEVWTESACVLPGMWGR